MQKELDALFKSIKAKQFKPVYLLDGDETFYLDQITAFFEEHALEPHEKDFNQTVLYGKETDLDTLLNTCQKYPMFAERQLVILKDAASMNKLADIQQYVGNPIQHTILVIEHRGKKVDGRSQLIKKVKEKGFYFTSEKIKVEKIPMWIEQYVRSLGLSISGSAAELLATYLGNDLKKIDNEIGKLKINLKEGDAITEAFIQEYLGVSRDYNIYELPEVIATRDDKRFMRMLQYFLSTQNMAPIQMLNTMLYSHFSKLWQLSTMRGVADDEAAKVLNMHPFVVKKLRMQLKHWTVEKLMTAMLLIAESSEYAVGLHTTSKPMDVQVKDISVKLWQLAKA